MSEYFLGIDIGGTKILTAIADSSGKILISNKRSTEADKGQDVIIDNIIKTIDNVLNNSNISKEEVASIGIGSPGPLNTKDGVIIENANLPWRDVPIVELLEERTGISPIFLENDANAAALGEKWFGAGRGVADLIYITISTGIGGGIIIDRRIYHGKSDIAGEVGHMIIDPNGPLCGCGNHGCFEAMASGTAINRMAKKVVEDNQESKMFALLKGDLNKINGKVIAEAAEMGDQLAQDIWKRAAYYMGLGIANLLNIFNPGMIILGGGVMKAWDYFEKPMMEGIKKHAFDSAFSSVEIKRSELGDDVGVKGAIAVAMGDRLLS
ncbi:ROK family protein [Iocasia frigidifontis]|uniref:Glucokinase n=1 Tax=Iocasia fonsfrigidae TaxID=2682810 RepID=A0A8A7KAB5_9FIRM|nr:ROK family protein [Iocasia fonsfrigidae]QTL97035.1 ROK family protein [Iocasia fonsfrigidae]